MNAEKFWAVIKMYNQRTILFQIIISIVLIVCSFYSFKVNDSKYIKISLGITNLFIGIVFFGAYGTEVIQKIFALPLYMAVGILLIIEGMRNTERQMYKLDVLHIVLIGIVVAYPVVSILLGKRYPGMVTNIMPCPVLSLSIVLYSICKKQSKAILVLFSIWGLTGVKSFIFNVYEDIILLICGVYCIYLLINSFKNTNKLSHMLK